MDRQSRGYKLLTSAKKEKDSSASFWAKKIQNNWFCNRPLSPKNQFDTSRKRVTESKYCVLLENVNEKPQCSAITDEELLLSADNTLEILTNKINKEKLEDIQTEASTIGSKFSGVCDIQQVLTHGSTPEKEIITLGVRLTAPSDGNINAEEIENANIVEETVDDSELNISLDSSGSVYNPSNEEGDSGHGNEGGKKDFDAAEIFEEGAKTNSFGTLEKMSGTPKSDRSLRSSEMQYQQHRKIYKRIRIRDYCYFCEIDVYNFARHIRRNHKMEVEVSAILSKPMNSKERRKLLDNLRRKGNFLKSERETLKPVRQSYLPNTSLLPCDNCLGYFSSKLLYRHRKKCLGVNRNNCNAQAAGQSTLLSGIRVDPRLKAEVFPHMRADKISLEAKKDALICAFGARYLNTHREQHFIQVTSRKMRELSKILIELRKLEPSINNMFQALQPKYFDLFVEATKTVAKYDVEKNIYEAPTFAMNISTSLKQCCDIAITFVLKRHRECQSLPYAEAEANLKTLIHLFNTNWRFEISSQAANSLNLNKWNKVTIVPLASDLKLLRQHLIQMGENASRQLKNDKEDSAAYNTLMETVYCRVILLNRKRPGELQRMLLHSYVSYSSEKQEYEEFNKAISSSEQILLKTLKRVVIKGKRGRGVPVLFSTDVQDHIQILLKLRESFLPKENPYLFGKANSILPITGYKILHKYAKSCGAKNPSSITSTRLRKHLATLSQLFSLTENEIEQLASFMGHTLGVHKNSYRLPDEIYQTAKISKLLLLMEKGGANEYKGKSLDEINIDMEENLLHDAEKSDESEIEDQISENLYEQQNLNPTTSKEKSSVSAAPNPRKSKIRVLIPWTNHQKRVVKQYFKNHIKARRPPKRRECEDLKKQHPDLLNNKDWLKIKVFVQNEYAKIKNEEEDE